MSDPIIKPKFQRIEGVMDKFYPCDGAHDPGIQQPQIQPSLDGKMTILLGSNDDNGVPQRQSENYIIRVNGG